MSSRVMRSAIIAGDAVASLAVTSLTEGVTEAAQEGFMDWCRRSWR
ncbi:hypothetical protein INT80_05715 [Gallibacterium anatis]|uniref:Uncharacterized protein n=1 Tax=Gallibacterium anatis TaxID=750 RepID=A0A930Y510_9PAST|nr:hypothetical protein [Gallibacterium anatis]